MTKAEIADKIHIELGFPKNESKDLLEDILLLMKDALASGETLKVSGFGSFIVKQKADRRGRNPQTGEAITIGSRRILTFKPSTVLRNRINAQNP